MKVATFNAASVRMRLPLILDWLVENEPDVLAIQETKVEDDKFPLADFEEIGYQVAIHGQKAWNGVAIASLHPIQNVRLGFQDDLFPTDARIIAAEVEGIQIVNTYVPNGTKVGSDKWDYKLKWLDRFAQYLSENYQAEQDLIWLGDINIAPTDLDVYEAQKKRGKVGHHPDEFKRLDKVVSWGLTDVYRKLHKEPGGYTYFDFVIPNSVQRNLGWRIDHIYATQSLADKCTECCVDLDARMQPKPSDHTFVCAEFDV